MRLNPDDSNFSKVYQQAARIIAGLTGTILMFTLIGFALKHFFPANKSVVMICVILGVFFGFAIMIKEALMSDMWTPPKK
jgi:F0F1-type ATP synthase assembly protein I